MASEETSTVNSMVIQFKAQMAVLKLDNKKLSDENHVLRLKMAADGKKLELVRKWITNFDTLYNHLKEIAKDWAADEPIQNENKANASNALAELNVEMRPMAAGGMRVILNRAKLAPRWSTTPTGILQTSMVSRLQKNLQADNAINNAAQAPGPTSSISDDVLDVEIKKEQAVALDEEAEKILAAVEPVPKKASKNMVLVVEQPQHKVDEKPGKKRKIQEPPKVRQTRSKAKASNDSNDEEPTEKRHRLVTPVPVLNSDDDDFDDDNGPVISQSKSVGGKATAKRLMTKRSSNY